jgi:hypothetical protein
MKNYFILLNLFFGLLFSNAWCSTLHCNVNLIDSSDKHLICLQTNNITKSVNKTFVDYKVLRKNCINCSEPFVNAAKYFHLFEKEYLALAISPQDFGGYNLYIIFRDEPLMYKLWFYQTDKGIFQLRALYPEEPTASISHTIHELNQKNKYWQRAGFFH